ncbi:MULTISPECIES: glycosyltransferase family 4 protein [unclassified Halomonas]|uniref:glycosyltransferase family 4 protein n=1 Tax=unclassified Halomonas TaxID=2609666 RepID=UPI001C96993B|nr:MULTISPECIES: glycosyltransferase family 4 protein [unclassified Halomonas]MBY5925421.1 glycosyltransferase family 4 protein [Halomonas sp. DP4Y7-2]MBY6232761.1 glycosyltransferase family 4 protein [Halomonas sp. DP4Y7-1]
MKKVMFVANSEWYLKNFRKSTLLSFGKKYRVICSFPNVDTGEALNDLNVKISKFYMRPESKNPFKEAFTIFSMFLNFLKMKPSLVFSFNPKTNLYSLLCCSVLRIPCVVNVSGVGAASQLDGISGRIYRFLAKILYRRAEFVFFQNSDNMREFKDSCWLKNDSYDVLPGSGVDLNLFAPSSEKHDGLRFLMAARLIKAKGVEEYISAARHFRSIPECEFYLAGMFDDSNRAVDRNTIDLAVRDGCIQFLGHVEDMASLLNQVDCIVLPSYYPEGTPRSLIEAAAAGKIIITTDMPGCRDLVRIGLNGFLVETKSTSSIVDAIGRVISLSDASLVEMKKMSRLMAEEKYDETIIINKYLRIAARVTAQV